MFLHLCTHLDPQNDLISTGNLCFLGLARMLGFAYEIITPVTYRHSQHELRASAAWVIR
jgi:hypothetical protein